MIQDKLLLIVILIFVISMFAIISEKLKLSYPITLVLSGLGISLIPGVPNVILNPELVFVIFLPPLLYFAAWNTSWAEFWKFRTQIGTLAFGLVLVTASVVALVANLMIPGFTLEAGFLLGAIVSPPDAVAASSVLRNLRIPRSVNAILEGESLVNDAASLVIFRLALGALLTGDFVFANAGQQFFLTAILGILIGLLIALAIYYIHKCLPTTASIDTVLTLITPYILYLTAEHFHASGVLSVVSGGLFLSYRSADLFAFDSRLRMTTVWTVIEYLLNGVVFILIGLQLPTIIAGLGKSSLSRSVGFALLITMLTILIRIVWIFIGNRISNLLSAWLKKRKTHLDNKQLFVIAWSGMRGVVSLASALALPLTLTNGAVFPERSLILFTTFIVILVTLILQGISLPILLKKLKLESQDDDYIKELEIKLKLANLVLDYLNSVCHHEIAEIHVFKRVKEKYERMAANASETISIEEQKAPEFMKTYRQMLLDIIQIRRNELEKMHRHKEYPDHLIRAKERDIDFEEARIRKF